MSDKRSPTEKQKIARVAAGLAVSNFGMSVPESVTRCVNPWPDHAEYSVADIAAQYCESDEHLKMFEEEAIGWEKEIQKIGLEQAAKTYSWHPWILEIISL